LTYGSFEVNGVRQKSLLEFVQNNQDWLAGMRKDLNSLAPEDKKALVESLVPGKIPVWLANTEDIGSGPKWGLGAFPPPSTRQSFTVWPLRAN